MFFSCTEYTYAIALHQLGDLGSIVMLILRRSLDRKNDS